MWSKNNQLWGPNSLLIWFSLAKISRRLPTVASNWSMSMYYIYTCLYIYIYMYVYMFIYIYIHIYIYHAYHIDIYIYIYIYIIPNVYIYIYKHIWMVYTWKNICMRSSASWCAIPLFETASATDLAFVASFPTLSQGIQHPFDFNTRAGIVQK